MYSLELLLSACLLLLLVQGEDSTTDSPVSGGSVTRKAGENGTLACVSARGDEQIEGIMWRKGDTFLVSEGGSGIQYLDDSLAQRMSIEDNNSLLIRDVEVDDSGNYTCRMFVFNTSEVEERELAWELIVQDVPSPPGRAEWNDVQSRQVTVSWTPSEHSNNSPISNYIIQISECKDGDSTKREVVVASTTLQVTIRELMPNTCYRVQVRSRNSVGRSLPGVQSDFIYTESEAPSAPPENFQAESISGSEINITWTPPPKEHRNGILQGFKITHSCQDCGPITLTVDDPAQTSKVLNNLKPYTWYTVSILAYNDEGEGPMAEVAVQTREGLPSSPRITHITNRESTSFYVHWEPPKELRGRLTAYELHWFQDDDSDPKTRIISGHLTNPMSAFITGLRPYTEYKIQVAALTGGGRGKFSEKYPALTDIAAPSAPYILNVTVLSPHSVYISWDSPAVFFRRIDKYIIKWWDTRGNDPDTMLPGTKTEHVLEGLPTNMRYNLKLAGVTQALFSKRYLVGEFTRPVTFTLGDQHFKEAKDEGVPKEVIAGVTCAIIIVLVGVVIFIGYRSFACRKCYQAAYYYLAVPSNNQSTPPTVITVAEPSDEKEYPEIPAADFPAHVEAMHADSDFAFSQEFDDLYRHTRTDFKCEASNMPENRNKNRYINIAAFDHSRVLLKMDLGRLRQSDYINANYVDGYKKPKAYIATQGPLPQTFADFWRMVWEQNCSVIVMITNLMEKGRRKCDQYWPSDGLELYGNMSVKLLSTVPRAHYTVNVFSLRNMKVKKRHSMKSVSERTVYQYHYTEWPDHGVPDYTLPVLEFVQKSAACNPPDGGPIIVHCSAGVGRTGTYILIDSMIRQIQDCGTINIPGFTLHIRRQRNLLVQTEDQYMFIHDVLVEYLMGGGQTEVTEDNINSYVAALTASANGVAPHQGKMPDSSSLEKQYKLITSYSPSDDDLSNALKPVNAEKNRSSTDFLPVNLKRVVLPARPGVEGSDYINATYLQGYKKSDEFIVTQYPLESTKEDFWRMVWDRNSPIIIILTSPDEEQMPEFWPEKGSPVEVDCGNFKLSMRDDPDIQPSYVIRDFILESIQYDYIFMTKVIVVTDWPDSSPPTYPVFCMVENAIEWQKNNDIGPIIVMDLYGGVRAGRFCALWALRDQLMMDKVVDVYQLVKLYHLKRPGIVGSQDDLRYLYDAMVCLQEHLREEEGSVGSVSPRHHSNSRKNGTLPRSSTLSNSTTTSKTETNI